MEHLFSRSISGRVFSRSGSHGDEDDPFACMLSRLHREACRVGIEGGSVVIYDGTMFNPRLLVFVNYAVSVYRHVCNCGWWETDALIDALNEIEEGDRIEGDAEWYFSGALLFCVDRALVSYQRGRFWKAEDWADCAQWLRFSLCNLDFPYPESDNDHHDRMKALNLARHRSNHAAREKVVREWEKNPATWPSAEKAGLYFANLLEKEGSTYEPRTVTGWIRAHANLKGIRFR